MRRILTAISVSVLLASLFLTPVLGQSPIRYVSSMNVYQGDAVGSMSNLQEQDTKRIIITEEDLYPDNGSEYDLRIEALPRRQNNSYSQSAFDRIIGCSLGTAVLCLREPSWQPNNQLNYVGWYRNSSTGYPQLLPTAVFDMYNISGYAQAQSGSSYLAATWTSQYWRNLIEPIPPDRYVQFYWSAERWDIMASILCADSGPIQLMNFTWHTEIYTNANCTGSLLKNHQVSMILWCGPFPPDGDNCRDVYGVDMFIYITQISIGVGNNLQDFSLAANFDIEIPEGIPLDELFLVCDTDVSTVYTLSIIRDTTPRGLGAACDTTAVQTFTLEPTDLRSDGKVRLHIEDGSSVLSADLNLDMMRITINVTPDEYFVSGDNLGFVIVFLFISSGILFAAWVVYKYREGGGI